MPKATVRSNEEIKTGIREYRRILIKVIKVVKYDSISVRESVIHAEGRRSNDVTSDSKNSLKAT